LALVMGFRIPVNFNSPYKAMDLTDFWRRWHISLSRWLKDYLYIPLGGNRKGKFRTGLNLMTTMLLGGLWHGASMRFVLWGGLHGIGLIFSKIKNRIIGENSMRSAFFRFISILVTFHFVSFAWIFFRSANMTEALIMFSRIFGDFAPGAYMEVLSAYLTVFVIMAMGFVLHMLPEKVKESYRGLFINSPLVAQFIMIVLVAVWLCAMRGTEVMPFIYFRF
jgi:alginate O-acetyltransferase complex protein AlgI